MSRLVTTFCTLFVAALVASIAAIASAEPAPADDPGARVTVDEQLERQLDMNLAFTDHNGQQVTLGSLFSDNRPVLFTLNYYGCPMLCGLQLNAVADALKAMDWLPGREYRVITLSFNPEEGADLASAKRTNYLEYLGRDGADWTFLTGDQASIQAVADSFGYRFEKVEATGEYAHPAAIMFLSPDGRVMRYLYGLTYDQRDVKFALMEAAEGHAGSTMERLILACYMYDPAVGGYVKDAMLFMRLGGVVSMIFVGGLLLFQWRKERARRVEGAIV